MRRVHIRMLLPMVVITCLFGMGMTTPSVNAHAEDTQTLTSYLGIDPATYHGFLREHSADSTYLSTPYPPPGSFYHDGANGFAGWQDPAGGHMNCEGFVDNALKNCGASGPVAVAPGGEGWTMVVRNHNIEHADFTSKQDMISSGVLSYGDIIYMYDGTSDMGLSDHHHIGIFVGDDPHDDKLWHSIDEEGNVYGQVPSGNQISSIIPKSENCHFWRVIKVGAVGSIEIQKTSDNPLISDGNDIYSLAGAEYTIYKDQNLNESAGILTTDANGYAKVDGLPAGTYFVKETVPAKGYAIDDTVCQVHVASGTTTRVNDSSVSDVPQGNPVEMIVSKVDAQSGDSKAQGSATLEGAEYTVSYYNGYYDEGGLPDAPTRSWVVRTDSNGKAHLGQDHLVSGDDLYHATDGAQVVLPLGTVTIRETKAPEGYMVDDALYVQHIIGEGMQEEVHSFNAPTSPEQVKRGDLRFVKEADDSRSRMAHVPFKITSMTTGEVHVIATDGNGAFSSSNEYADHAQNTNANDWALDEDEIIDASKLDFNSSCWFAGDETGEISPDSTGAFPYDTYVIEEMRATSNDGYAIPKPATFRITRDDYEIDLGTMDNPRPSLSTVATDSSDGDHAINAADVVGLNDAVSFRNVIPDKEYEIRSEVHFADTGEIVRIDDTDLATSKTFTAAETSGSVDVTYTLDATLLQGRTLVVYETLYDVEGNAIARHCDKDDTDQQVDVIAPQIETQAFDGADGDKDVLKDPHTSIVDTVSYSGVIPGKEYVISGSLHQKVASPDDESDENSSADERDTAKTARDSTDERDDADAAGGSIDGSHTDGGSDALCDAEGNPITAEVAYTPGDEHGSVDVIFEFDGTEVDTTKPVVVFERLSLDGETVAVHEDIDSNDQSVRMYDQPPSEQPPNTTLSTYAKTGVNAIPVLIGVAVLVGIGIWLMGNRGRRYR